MLHVRPCGGLPALSRAQAVWHAGGIHVEAATGLSSLLRPETLCAAWGRRATRSIQTCVANMLLMQAGDEIQTFLWDQFADWYLETSKVRIFAAQKSDDPEVQAAAAQARRVLLYVLDTNLRLLHPFMPYITEAIWQRLPHSGNPKP